MTPEVWGEVRKLLERALAADQTERAAILKHADPEVRAEVLALLAAEQKAAAMFPTGTIAPSLIEQALLAQADALPERLGPYRVIRRIGQGGMGVVYEADRDDGQFHQHVAIKVLPAALTGGDFRLRFLREREILARLEHPGITRLLDGGVTDAGAPYLVMEFVDGDPLTRYARARNLCLPERIVLLRRVCDAVEYAHRRLIIHRDLKPGNILVNREGLPKLLDFGLAKVLDESLGADITLAAPQIFTPAYASPEQIRGEPLTVATDVFSLGIVFYELVSGEHPFHAAGNASARQQMLSAILMDRPRPLPGVDRDLAAIATKATEKDPAERYPSVEALRADLDRYLAGRPVSVRSNALHRVRKFIARHRIAVSASGLALAAVIGATGVALRNGRVAQQRLENLRSLSSTLIFEVHDAVAPLPGSTKPRALIVSRGVEYLDQLAAVSGSDPSLLREAAAGYQRLAAIQGRPGEANLGDQESARASLRKSVIFFERLGRATPADAAALLDHASALADLARLTQGPEVEKLINQAALLAERASTLSSARDIRARAAGIRFTRAQFWRTSGHAVEALHEFKAIAASYEQLHAEQPGAPSARDLAVTYKRIGAMEMVSGNLEASGDAYRKALALEQEFPGNSAAARLDLSYTFSDLGTLELKRERLEDALRYYQQAFDLRREAYWADKANERARSAFVAIMSRLGGAYVRLARWEEATATYRDCLRAGPAGDSSWCSYHLAESLWHLGRKEEAATQWQASRQMVSTSKSTLTHEERGDILNRPPWIDPTKVATAGPAR